MYLELQKEVAAATLRRDCSLPLSDDDRLLSKVFELYRYASSHKPHGCLVLPCAVCRGERVSYEEERR